MKHFRLILSLLRIVVALLFAANILFMVQLYGSIKDRYIDDVEQSLHRADQIEMVDRIINSGVCGEDSVLWLSIGLKKSDVGDTMDSDELHEKGYSQGYKRVDRQLMNIISGYLHDNNQSDYIGEPDLSKMEEAFRRDLSFSGYNPEEILIVLPENRIEYSAELWEIKHIVNDRIAYYAYISPLTNKILGEMSGVLCTSALIALVLTFGFWYLLHVIHHLRTIEEMKDDFTNNMTHELKTPIAIAYAANDALLQFPDPEDENRTKKYLSASLEQLSKLAGLVESILAMSMERRKNLTMSKESLNLKIFLSSIIDQQLLKAHKSVNIDLDCPENIKIEADPTHFSNVISNLIDNSIKYSGDSVSVRVKADSESVSVSDNGFGIPEKQIPYIWNKFYRVPQGNRSDIRGYGIGLFYVKSIIDKHGWSINVESKLGKGSVFTIKFVGV